MSRFAWDPGPGRRYSARGAFTGWRTAAAGFLIDRVAVKRARTQFEVVE